MKLVKITSFDLKEIKFDKKGNAIIKLPPGTKRILIQGEKEGNVEDIQMKTILKAIDNLDKSLSSKIEKNTEAIKANTKAIKANTEAIKANAIAIKKLDNRISKIVSVNSLRE